MHNSVSIDMHLGFIQILFWGLKYRTYLNVHHKVNVVGLTGINISATNAISDIELEEYLTSNGVKLDMDSMWLGDEIRQVPSKLDFFFKEHCAKSK